MELRLARSCLLALLVIACSASTSALEPNKRLESYRGVVGDDTQQPSSQSGSQRVRLPRRLSSRHNELASTETAKKSSSSAHMLIGGHLRADTTLDSSPKDNESTLEDGLLLSSAGNGKEKKSSTSSISSSSSSSSSSSDDDDKKTLSQQVKEGKYGLIQNELFAEKPKRPGIISYSANPEVPRDSVKNLGGLDEEEIWLAEDHVLVIKGGNFPKSPVEQQSWKPIDDYEAPQRQVKIPSRPKVPPPFPIQLTEGGPVQLISANGSSVVENGTIDFEALPEGFQGFLPGEGPYFPLSNLTSDGPEKSGKAEGLPGPFYASLPPGAVIVPPPSNQTDYDDEDQSMYYPPPYSFVYHQDNSTDIPPGPLVPGIILPPPPDFFSALDEKKSPAKEKHAKRPTTPLPSGKLPYSPPRKPSTKLYKTASVTSTPLGPKSVAYNSKYSLRPKYKNATYQSDKTTARAYPAVVPFVEVTSPGPVRSSTLASPDKYRIQPALSNQVIDSSTEKPWRSVVSSKPVPLVTFFATTTPSSVEEPVETTPSAIKGVLTTESPSQRYPSQASYYFYEEANNNNNNNNNNDNNEETASPTPEPVLFFGSTAETPPYYKIEQTQPEQLPEQDKKDYYDVEMIPSQQTSKDYSVKLIDSVVKDPQIYRYLDSGVTSGQASKYEPTPGRSQSPRMLHSEPLYYQPVPTRSSPKLSYFTSPKPKSYYRGAETDEAYNYNKSANKPKPIYQYSFEATNYKRGRQVGALSKPEIEPVRLQQQQQQPQPQQQQQQQQPRRQKELALYGEYQDIQAVSDQYQDYEAAEPQLRTEKLAAYQERPAYYQPQSTTVAPVRATTLAAHQQYFTKQDEQLLDDVTKEYFTMFGKKLAGKLPSTTPIYGKSSVTERPSYGFGANDYASARQPAAFRPPQNIKVHYGDHTPGPYSLKDDVLVNYKRPLPPVNPDAEFISVLGPGPAGQKYRPRPALLQLSGRLQSYPGPQQRQRYEQLPSYEQAAAEPAGPFVPIAEPARLGAASRPLSLEADLNVNYKEPRPRIEPDAEFLPGAGPPPGPKPPNSYFAYRLPGDGGHFYFLTPQAISREEPAYLYSRPRASRLLRRRRGRDSD